MYFQVAGNKKILKERNFISFRKKTESYSFAKKAMPRL
jgi:hypothetical protein